MRALALTLVQLESIRFIREMDGDVDGEAFARNCYFTNAEIERLNVEPAKENERETKRQKSKTNDYSVAAFLIVPIVLYIYTFTHTFSFFSFTLDFYGFRLFSKL